MRVWGNLHEAYCRWCSKNYTAHKYTVKGGFCSPRCKQAHYRAYKKYVTAIQGKDRN